MGILILFIAKLVLVKYIKITPFFAQLVSFTSCTGQWMVPTIPFELIIELCRCQRFGNSYIPAFGELQKHLNNLNVLRYLNIFKNKLSNMKCGKTTALDFCVN